MPEAAPEPDAPESREEPSGLRRIWDALREPRRGQIVVGVLLAVVGFGAVTQVRANVDDASYSGYNEQDLIDLLSGLSGTSQRAQAQLEQLQQARAQLQSDTSQRQAALTQAEQQLSTLKVLAGTVPVTGPGIKITITEVTDHVKVTNMLDLIEELRSNGAEAIDVNGVRVVAQTPFGQGTAGLYVAHTLISAPYTVTAIGEPTTLEAAVTFTRGPGDELRAGGAQVAVAQSEALSITSTVNSSPSPSAAPSNSGGDASGAAQ